MEDMFDFRGRHYSTWKNWTSNWIFSLYATHFCHSHTNI